EPAPLIKDLLELTVDFVVQKSRESACRSHRPIQDGVYWKSHQSCIVILRGFRHYGIDELKRVVIIPYLRLAGGVPIVRRFFGDLLKHQVKEHIDFRVALNEVFEFLYDWMQRLCALLDLFDKRIQPIL